MNKNTVLKYINKAYSDPYMKHEKWIHSKFRINEIHVVWNLYYNHMLVYYCCNKFRGKIDWLGFEMVKTRDPYIKNFYIKCIHLICTGNSIAAKYSWPAPSSGYSYDLMLSYAKSICHPKRCNKSKYILKNISKKYKWQQL